MLANVVVFDLERPICKCMNMSVITPEFRIFLNQVI